MLLTQRILGLLSCVIFLHACSKPAAPPEESTAEAAARIAQSSIIIDTHIDVPYRLSKKYADVSEPLDSGDFDYPRAVAGGLNAAFMSIYTPSELEATGESKPLAEALIDSVERIVADSPEKFAIAVTPQDVIDHFEQGLVSLPMGMENGSPLEGDLANIRYFYDRGIRYITLTHGKVNHLSDSSYDDVRKWKGLSDLGKQAVAEMNRIGMMIDVSHLSDDAFWQVMKLTEAPVIASHSSARRFTPGMERNMSDEMIEALVANGGVIQINFGSSFLTEAAYKYMNARWDARKIFAAEHPEITAADLATTHAAVYAAEHGPFPFATLDDVLDHIDHAVGIAGIDHVGLGSDFDGVGDSLPTGLKDVSDYPNLIEGLLQRGYSEEDIRKILGENLLRVWRSVEAFAARS